ncbi:unnamed protein product, partial [Ectocarpus fasciculatus]
HQGLVPHPRPSPGSQVWGGPKRVRDLLPDGGGAPNVVAPRQKLQRTPSVPSLRSIAVMRLLRGRVRSVASRPPGGRTAASLTTVDCSVYSIL